MQDPYRAEVLRALMTLQEERLIDYQMAARLVDVYDEKKVGQEALDLTLDFEQRHEPVSLHEAMNMVQAGIPDHVADQINAN